jgi:hypothetical protein
MLSEVFLSGASRIVILPPEECLSNSLGSDLLLREGVLGMKVV